MPSSGLIISAEPSEELVRLSVKGGRRDRPGAVPDWLYKALGFRSFVCATRTPDGVISVFIGESFLNKVELPATVEMERQWSSLRISKADTLHAGFKTVWEALEAAKIDVQLVSSPSCEWFLMPSKQLAMAVSGLLAAGHAICPAARLCGPLPAKLGRHEKCRRFAGAWKLTAGEESEVCESSCFRLQGACGVYVDLRPASGLKEEASCAGFLHLDESSRHRLVGFQPPTGEASTVQLSYEGDDLHEDVPRFGRRTWRRLPDSGTRAVVLELIGEPNRSLCRQGYWLIAGDRFARIIGLSNAGIIDRYCCSSLGQLEKMFGSECIAQELDSHYEVVSGILVTPGHFLVEHEVPRGQAEAGGTFLDVESGIGGKIELPSKIGGEVLHHGPKGIQRWRVLEWGFDPFTPGSAAISEEQLPPEQPLQKVAESKKNSEPTKLAEKTVRKKRKKEATEAAATVRSLPSKRRNGEKLVQEQLPQDETDDAPAAGRISISIKATATEAAPVAGAQVAEAPGTTEAPDDNVPDDKAEEELQERDPLPANFKFPQGYPPPPPTSTTPGSQFPGNFKFPAGYPPPDQASVATEEEKAAVLAAVASAAAAGALPSGTKQAVVIPSAVGGAPIVLSTYRTALEGMSASQIAEALSEQVLPARSSLPPASALIAAAGAAAARLPVQQPLLMPGAFLPVAPLSLPPFLHLPPPMQATVLASSLPLPPPPPLQPS